jgi:methionyl-tRNA formyltransferase
MKRFENNHQALSNVILLTSRLYADILTPALIAENPRINVLQLVHPNQVADLDDDFLLSSRLISFGTRFYIPEHILGRIGYGSYNFHPGSTTYPGWAPFLYAIYEGAKQYGVTVHEMSPKIDAGKIIAVANFAVPEGATAQLLVDMTTHHMLHLFKDLSASFVNTTGYLETSLVQWQTSPNRKKDFDALCHIALDCDAEDMKRKIFAFGDSDGEVFPYVIVDGKRYRLAFEGDHPDRHSYWLHGTRFVIE